MCEFSPPPPRMIADRHATVKAWLPAHRLEVGLRIEQTSRSSRAPGQLVDDARPEARAVPRRIADTAVLVGLPALVLHEALGASDCFVDRSADLHADAGEHPLRQDFPLGDEWVVVQPVKVGYADLVDRRRPA